MGADTQLLRQHEQDMRAHRLMTLWVHFANFTLGAWLIVSPFTLGYLSLDVASDSNVLRVTAERGLPPLGARNLAMAWSDIASGALIMMFAALSFCRRLTWAPWGATFVGLWLLFAPLVLWTPSAAAYLNNTLIGCFVITFAILIPMMPRMDMRAMALGPDVPPGWNYSPSDWLQRIPIIAFAMIGFFIARYLSAYQLGHIPRVWDPFFGDGTERIITSHVSKAWPIADAGLGAVSYALEALSGAMGGRSRWRTMPWMVALFGVLVVPLGVVSIFFIIIQPIMLGTWCTLCLVTAAAMVIMLPYSLDELVAMGQFLAYTRRKSLPFWLTFWRGGVIEGGRRAEDSKFEKPFKTILREMLGGGVNYPWTLVLCIALGVWLMCTRLIFGNESAMANSDHLVGSLVITFTFIAFAEVARPVRFINVLFGIWLIIAPWVLAGAGPGAGIGSVIVGILLIAFSLPRGTVTGRYGGWDLYIV